MSSIKEVANFNPEVDAAALKKAMKGLGTDEKAINNILAYRTNSQRQKIRNVFKQVTGKDLIKELKSEVSGDYERLIVGLMMSPAEYDAYCLNKAIKGAGTNEAVLIEILASRSNSQIKEIREVYKKTYNKELEDAISGDTSGSFKHILISLNNAGRSESDDVDEDMAEAEAKILLAAGEKQWGTNESAFNKIMASRSHKQLRAMFRKYYEISNKDITKSLESEFSGNTLKCMLAIVGVVRDPPSYFAHQLHKSMKGAGTDEGMLIRIVVTRSEIDMEDIKSRFQNTYNQPLSKFISGDTSGDFKKLLLAVVGN